MPTNAHESNSSGRLSVATAESPEKRLPGTAALAETTPAVDSAIQAWLTAFWLLFPEEAGAPLDRLDLQIGGWIQGGRRGEQYWELTADGLLLLDARKVALFRFAVDPEAPATELRGCALTAGAAGGRSLADGYRLRRCGLLRQTRVGPLPRSCADPRSFAQQYTGRQDFTYRAFGEREVRTTNPHSVSFSAGCPTRSFPDFYAPMPHYSAPEVNFHVLHDCDLLNGTVVVDREGAPFFDTTYFAEERSQWTPISMSEIDEAKAIYLNDYMVDEYVPGTTVLFCSFAGNYGHWHMQSVPVAWMVDQLESLGLESREALNLIVVHGLSREPFRAPSLRALGLHNAKIIDPIVDLHTGLRKDLRFERLIVPSLARVPFGQCWQPEIVADVARRLRRERHGRRRLFLSRRDVPDKRRGLLNEDDVLAALSPMGFEPLRCADMTYEDQLQAFADAEVVVSPHGGALTNMLAAAPGLIVFELFHSHQMNNWYRNLAFICGHEYHAHCVAPQGPADRWDWHSSLAVDPEFLARRLQSLLPSRPTA